MSVPTRDDIRRSFPNASQSILLAVERLFHAFDSLNSFVTTGADATSALQDATVLTTSPNDTFNNERVVAAGQGIRLTDNGANLIISLLFNFIVNGGERLTINLSADSDLTVIQSGTVMIEEGVMPTIFSRNFASDAAAATGGVPLQGFYHNAGSLRIRLS